jgi:hypothetical protein
VRVSASDMINQMYHAGSTLQGWDVVVNLSEAKVNEWLQADFAGKHSDSRQTIDIRFCQSFGTMMGYTRFTFELSGPTLMLQPNTPSQATMRQAIVGGSMQTAMGQTTGEKPCDASDPSLPWGSAKELDLSQGPYIQGTVALAVGTANGTVHPVVVDDSQSSFVVHGLMEATDEANLNQALTSFFEHEGVAFQLNAVDFGDYTEIARLQPKHLRLNTLRTNSMKDVLQLFVATTETPPDSLTINVNEPLPDGFDLSVLVSSQVFFADLFVPSFNKANEKVQATVATPVQNTQAWGATLTALETQGELDFKDQVKNWRISEKDNQVSLEMKGIALGGSATAGIDVRYDHQMDQPFQHKSLPDTLGVWKDFSTTVSLSLSGTYPLALETAADPTAIELKMANGMADTQLSEFDLACNAPKMTTATLAEIKRIVQPQVKELLARPLVEDVADVALNELVTFVVRNLVFPGKAILRISEVFVPGDVVLLGDMANSGQ